MHACYFALRSHCMRAHVQPTRGEQRRTRSLEASLKLLEQLVEALVAVGWRHWELHLFGFSQGGTAALALMQRYTGGRKLGGWVRGDRPRREGRGCVFTVQLPLSRYCKGCVHA